MTNQEIVSKLQTLVKEERRITHEILVLIKEAEARKLYAERGYPSSFEWLIKEFGYSESAAYRRIQAARLLDAVPEVGEKLQSGEVNLTTLAKVQSVIRSEEKRTQAKVSCELKTEIVRQIEGKSSKETQNTLAGLFPEVAEQKIDRVVVTSDDSARMTVNLSKETLKELERVKELLSHVKPDAQWSEIIDYLAKAFLKQKDPLRKSPTNLTKKDSLKTQGDLAHNNAPKIMPSNTAAVSLSSKLDGRSSGVSQNQKSFVKTFRRPISASLRSAVYQRDQGRCQYKDSKTGRICGSKYFVEIDHIRPVALGGSNVLNNLRCLCRKHNLLMATKVLGPETMQKWERERPLL